MEGSAAAKASETAVVSAAGRRDSDQAPLYPVGREQAAVGEFQIQPARLLVTVDFPVLFVVTLFAEFIANDKPFFVQVRRAGFLSRGRSTIRRPHLAATSKRRPTIAIPTCKS